MNKTPNTWALKSPLRAQPLPFCYSTVSNERLLCLKTLPLPILKPQNGLNGRRCGAEQAKVLTGAMSEQAAHPQLQPTWHYVTVFIRWRHIKGAIRSVFKHQYIIVRWTVNPCGCIVNKQEQELDDWWFVFHTSVLLVWVLLVLVLLKRLHFP